MLLPGPSRGTGEGSGSGWRERGKLELCDKEEFPALKRRQTLRAERTGSRPLSLKPSPPALPPPLLGEGVINDP